MTTSFRDTAGPAGDSCCAVPDGAPACLRPVKHRRPAAAVPQLVDVVPAAVLEPATGTRNR